MEKKKKITGMRLNAFLAHAGIASRRKAVELIEAGEILVNGVVVTEPWYEVREKDQVSVAGKPAQLEQFVYILLHKPTGYVTTSLDEQGRPTVLDLIGDEIKERVYPVGRLDQDTTGLLLLTNDGDLAQRLAHPSGEVEKAYAVKLNKPFDLRDADKLRAGITLTDGPIRPDRISVDRTHRRRVSVYLHSGRNRIVRRMFAALGYEVEELHRFAYAGLTLGLLKSGQWRMLTEKEVEVLRK